MVHIRHIALLCGTLGRIQALKQAYFLQTIQRIVAFDVKSLERQ